MLCQANRGLDNGFISYPKLTPSNHHRLTDHAKVVGSSTFDGLFRHEIVRHALEVVRDDCIDEDILLIL